VALWVMSSSIPVGEYRNCQETSCLHTQGWFFPSSLVQISLLGGELTGALKKALSSNFISIFYFSFSKQHCVLRKVRPDSLFHFPPIDSRQCKIFLFSTASRPTLGPTHPPIQWVSGTLSPGVKRQRREADHSPASSAEVKKVAAIPSLPHMSSWRGA
jgi:hypothetical protein